MSNNAQPSTNTTVVNKHIVFLKDDAGWYADMEGTRAQNAMVAGADTMIEALSAGGTRVEMVFSSDVEQPGDHIMHLHRVEHDPWGATYHVKNGNVGEAPRFSGIMGMPYAWLCNQTHRFIGGEHPKDVFVHSIERA